MASDALREAIRERLAPIAAEHQVQIDYRPLFPGVPAFETPENAPIVQACEALTGYRADAVAFATEGPYLNQLGAQTLILGPGDIAQAHQPDEFLAMDRLQPTIDLLQGLIRRFCLQ